MPAQRRPTSAVEADVPGDRPSERSTGVGSSAMRRQPLKFGLKMNPTSPPSGFVTSAVTIPPPTSLGWRCGRSRRRSIASSTAAAHVVDAPVDLRALVDVGVGQQAELVARDVEADVEGLVEVRVDAQEPGPPRRRRIEVVRRVDDGAQPLELHVRPPGSGSDLSRGPIARRPVEERGRTVVVEHGVGGRDELVGHRVGGARARRLSASVDRRTVVVGPAERRVHLGAAQEVRRPAWRARRRPPPRGAPSPGTRGAPPPGGAPRRARRSARARSAAAANSVRPATSRFAASTTCGRRCRRSRRARRAPASRARRSRAQPRSTRGPPSRGATLARPRVPHGGEDGGVEVAEGALDHGRLDVAEHAASAEEVERERIEPELLAPRDRSSARSSTTSRTPPIIGQASSMSFCVSIGGSLPAVGNRCRAVPRRTSLRCVAWPVHPSAPRRSPSCSTTSSPTTRRRARGSPATSRWRSWRSTVSARTTTGWPSSRAATATRLVPVPHAEPVGERSTSGAAARGRARRLRPGADVPRWVHRATTGSTPSCAATSPHLFDGLSGAAFHGIIRLAYALESASDARVAAGLAYLTEVHQPLGERGLAAADHRRPHRRTRPRAPASTEPARCAAAAGNIGERMRAVAAHAEFDGVVDWLAVDDATPARLTDAAVALYAKTDDFMALHGRHREPRDLDRRAVRRRPRRAQRLLVPGARRGLRHDRRAEARRARGTARRVARGADAVGRDRALGHAVSDDEHVVQARLHRARPRRAVGRSPAAGGRGAPGGRGARRWLAASRAGRAGARRPRRPRARL